jgi:ArsR family transcriptional regulator, arsenate/arsenite/antimonite-responsive transcriptional repressor
MDPSTFNRITKALADPRRFDMLELIVERDELSCGEVVEHFPIGQSTVSHHLRILVDAGLVAVRRLGQHALFRVRRSHVEDYLDTLKQRLCEPHQPRRIAAASSSRARHAGDREWAAP